jgi:acetyltransferase-like isoleucine patch superfamily enzyme
VSEVGRRSFDDECVDSYLRRRADVRQRWQRDLPFDELVFDRWERARSLGFGEGASVYHNAYIYGNVSVGEKTWIGPQTILDGSGGTLRIGKYCSISAGVQIYTHHTVRWALSGGQAPYEQAPTEIGDCCYVGPYAVIAMGVTIGAHSLIGAHAVVNHSVDACSIVFGAPGRVVGRVEVGDDGAVRLEYFKDQQTRS